MPSTIKTEQHPIYGWRCLVRIRVYGRVSQSGKWLVSSVGTTWPESYKRSAGQDIWGWMRQVRASGPQRCNRGHSLTPSIMQLGPLQFLKTRNPGSSISISPLFLLVTAGPRNWLKMVWRKLPKFDFCRVEAKVYQTPSSPLSLIYSPRTSSPSSTPLRLPTLLTKRPLTSPSRMRWILNFRRPCIWTSNETSRVTGAHLMAISHFQKGLCSKDTNISAQVPALHS